MKSRDLQTDFRTYLGTNWMLAILLPLLVLGAFSGNPFLTLAALGVGFLVFRSFWRPGEPPILLYLLGYQWIQGTSYIFVADVQGLPLQAMDKSLYVEEATWLTLLGLVAVAGGVRLGCGKRIQEVHREAAVRLAHRLSLRRLFLASLTAMAIASFMTRFAFAAGGLAQFVLALTQVHWAIEIIFAFTVMTQRRGYRLLAVIFILEMASGFLGFFSDFKTVLILFILAAMASPSALRGLRFQTVALASVLTLLLGVVWTGVKIEYRDFLNQGSGEQVVVVPVQDRVRKLAELVGGMNQEKFEESAMGLVDRLSYVHYFGESLKNVPSHIPHENGKLWAEALSNAMVPRFLNPSKAVLDDSIRTMYYTGEWIIGSDLGTSVSLGYMAESYIDFGPVFMFGPLLAWGFLIGTAYSLMVRTAKYPLFGFAFATVPLFMSASALETSNAKMLGGLVIGSLVLGIVQKVFSERLLTLLLPPIKPARPLANPPLDHPAGGGRDLAPSNPG